VHGCRRTQAVKGSAGRANVGLCGASSCFVLCPDASELSCWKPSTIRFSSRFQSCPLASTPPGMPGTHPPNFLVGKGRQREYPPILFRTFGYSRPILVALRSLSLQPISFGYKTPPIRFSQAGGQSAHKARPPNLELALTPLVLPHSAAATYCCVYTMQPVVEPVVQPVLQRVLQPVVSCKRRFSLPVHAASVVKDLFLYVYSSFFHATTLFSALSSFCHFILHILLFIYIDTIIRNFSCLHARRFTRFFYRIYRLICRKIIYHLSRICRLLLIYSLI